MKTLCIIFLILFAYSVSAELNTGGVDHYSTEPTWHDDELAIACSKLECGCDTCVEYTEATGLVYSHEED